MNSAYHRHHRKLRSHGGNGYWGNMIELPSDVHRLVHENPEVAYRYGLLVKSYDDEKMIQPDVRGFCAELGYEPEEKPKRKIAAKDSEARRTRKRISLAVPADTENGGELWDAMLEMVRGRLIKEGRYPEGHKIPAYEALMAALYDWYTSA